MDSTKYPIGTQSFEQLRNNGCAYVDKTAYVYDLAHRGGRIFFLARPRRFGKSLLLSTFEAYFAGRKDLFEGLAISRLEERWDTYPVIHIDFSSAEAFDQEHLIAFISNRLSEYEQSYAVPQLPTTQTIGERFGRLIRQVRQKEGKDVVVLIDEYDKGIVETLEDEKRLNENQEVLRSFFTQLKATDDCLRFVFVTGVARFRHYTLFSGFNNVDDISMDVKYATICGISEQELTDNFDSGIMALAQDMYITKEHAIGLLRQKYDGYRFSRAEDLVYNPFSVLNCLSKKELSDYWLMSGTSKIFVNYLQRTDFDITELEDLWAPKTDLLAPYSTENPVSLLFQTGYLTIKDYADGLYKLGIPNSEVRNALVNELVPHFMGVTERSLPKRLIELRKMINQGDADGFLLLLQSMMATVPYHEIDAANQEKTYHLFIYQAFLMIGVDAKSEISMSGGRIDMVIQTNKYVYVMEFKLGGTPQQALRQIDERGYSLPWRADGRNVLKIGVVFSPETRTIASWEIAK